MAFFHTCPNCGHLLDGDSVRPGTAVVCPECAAGFTLAEASVTSVTPVSGSAAVQDYPPDPATRPLRPEPEINIALSGSVQTADWGLVRRGLGILQISMFVMSVFGSIFLFLLLISLHNAEDIEPDRFWGGALTWSGLLSLAALLAGFVGQCLCCTVPAPGWLRTRAAVWTAATVLTGVFLAVTLRFQAHGDWHANRSLRAVGLGLGLLTLLCAALALSFWALFLKGVGRVFGNETLASSAQLFLVAGLFYLGMDFCVNARVPEAGESGIVTLLLNFFFPFLLYAWLAVLVIQARHSIG